MTDAIRIVDSTDAFAGSLGNKGDGEIACVCVAQDSAQLEEFISLAKKKKKWKEQASWPQFSLR